MSIRKLFLMMGVSIFWSGCSSLSKQSPLEHWKTFNNGPSGVLSEVDNRHTMVVFIREKTEINRPAINIFINGNYLTSLLPGGYKTQSLCANPTKMSAAYTQSELNYSKVRQQSGVQLLTAGKIQYFKLVEDSSHAVQFQALSEEGAQAILPNLKEQINTMSRVKNIKDCPDPVYIQVPVKTVLNKYTLQASTLFSYGKSGLNDLNPKGREEIVAISSKIKRDEEHISHLAVLGYTDPVGSELSNQQLSQRRAETVREILVANGVVKQTILVEGRGEQDLVVSDCDRRYAKDKAARTQCDLPNRRVEIITYGMKAE